MLLLYFLLIFMVVMNSFCVLIVARRLSIYLSLLPFCSLALALSQFVVCADMILDAMFLQSKQRKLMDA